MKKREQCIDSKFRAYKIRFVFLPAKQQRVHSNSLLPSGAQSLALVANPEECAKRDELRLLQIPNSFLDVRITSNGLHETAPTLLVHNHGRSLERAFQNWLIDMFLEQGS